mgnify:CR=1 FL=1
MCSCSPARRDHNTAALQPESHQSPALTVTISADGKLSSAYDSDQFLDEGDIPDVINVIIDGNQMIGGAASPTLSGIPGEFLPASVHFSLSHFEALDDGRYLARYVKRHH